MAEEDRGSACGSWPAQLEIYPWALLNLQPPRAEKNYKWNRLQSCLFGVFRLHNPSWKHIWQGLRRNVNSIFPLQVHLLSQHSVDLSLISSSDSSALFVCGHTLHMDASQSIECSKARPKRKSPVGLSRVGSSSPGDTFSSALIKCHSGGSEPDTRFSLILQSKCGLVGTSHKCKLITNI